ncbi:hypothetical protein [Methanosarcina horonobensis]|uniref:hypothetical protein n=1 Tax=Methanosarcina horonobensis TaxID=418008 RepID=UPI00064F0D4C|nr:hypothetical protein [Methanosarcina horonobensis]
MFKEVCTESPQCFDRGRKSLKSKSKSKTATATDAPSGTPGVVIIVNTSEEAEVDGIKLVSVTRTPLVNSCIYKRNKYAILYKNSPPFNFPN